MVTLPSLVTSPFTRQLLALLAATLSGVLVLLLLAPRRRGLDIARLLRDPALQVTFADRAARATGRRKGIVRAALQDRLTQAGLTDWRPVHVLLAALLCGLLGLAGSWELLPVPPSAALGFVGGALLFWAALGELAHRRSRLIEEQIATALSVMAGAAAAGATPQQALLEVLAEEADDPLAWHLRRATRDLDPQAGLTDRSFLQVIASLNADLASPSFTLAAQAIGAGVRLGVPLAESLEHIASLAHEDIAFRAEARADFAYTRGAALLVFSLPPLLTLALHWLEPASVAEAYSGLQGWAVAGALATVCVVGYRTVTAGERRATRRVGGGRAP